MLQEEDGKFLSQWWGKYWRKQLELVKLQILAIPPMVNDAKQVAMNTRHEGNANKWRDSNNHLLQTVRGVRDAIGPDYGPDMSSLTIHGML